jgi:NAD(P)H-flavin reductase
VDKTIFVKEGLFFRGRPGELSPYNPVVRRLIKEQKSGVVAEQSLQKVRVLGHTPITPTISRFKLQLSTTNTARPLHEPGQWVALDFSSELNMGYSHMRDSDPRSLNDDFIRTFTVSSHPSQEKDGVFEVTMRRVGVATDFLFKSAVRNASILDIGVRGFGGEFIVQSDPHIETGFIAGGVGITPLLAALPSLDLSRFHLLWTVHAADVPLVTDTLDTYPDLGPVTKLFVTSSAKLDGPTLDEQLKRIEAKGTTVQKRRLSKEDFDGLRHVEKWYTCTSPALRKDLMGWLEDKEVLYEDFNF